MPKYMAFFGCVPEGIEEAIKKASLLYKTEIKLSVSEIVSFIGETKTIKSAIATTENKIAIRELENYFGISVFKNKDLKRQKRYTKEKPRKPRILSEKILKAEKRRISILNIYESGLTTNQIAKNLGLSPQRVNQILLKAGYTPRRRRISLIGEWNPEKDER